MDDKVPHKVYVCARSKADLNRKMATDLGDLVTVRAYDEYSAPYDRANLRAMPTGTTVVLYTSMADGNPIAKSWGTWNRLKRKVI